MAILSALELAAMRRRAREDIPDADVDFGKPTINDAFQAIEDWYEGERVTVSGLIDTGTSPKVFTNTEKKTLAKAFLEFKFGVGG